MRLDLYECAVSRTRWHFVRIETADGAVGYGECSDAGMRDEVARIAEEVLPAFAALDGDLDVDAIAAAARRAVAGGDLVRRTVVGGVEQAACDIAARRQGLPLWKWLGGDGTQLVPLYANINRTCGGRTAREVAAAGVRAVADGFTAVKCAPFDAPMTGMSMAQAGLARVAALRTAVGEGIELMVDCHERMPLAELIPLLPAIAALDVGWLEDAVAVSDLSALRALRGATAMRLAGGECAGSSAELLPAVDEQLLDVVMPDVKHAGGVLQAAGLAASVGAVDVSPHNPSGPIGTAASAHLFLAVPRATRLEYAYGEVDWRADLVFGQEEIRAGHLVMPPGPGLGVDLDVANDRVQHVRTLTL